MLTSFLIKATIGFLIGVVGRFLLHQVWVMTADSFIMMIWKHAKAYADPKPDHPTRSPLACPDCEQTLYNMPQ